MIFNIPIKLPSVANLRDHWATKAKRNKFQRQAIALRMRLDRGGLLKLHAAVARGEQLRVTFIRVAPRRLDDDNLASAFKSCRDEVAKQLGINDGSDAVVWRYKQQKPELYGFKAGVMVIAHPVSEIFLVHEEHS